MGELVLFFYPLANAFLQPLYHVRLPDECDMVSSAMANSLDPDELAEVKRNLRKMLRERSREWLSQPGVKSDADAIIRHRLEGMSVIQASEALGGFLSDDSEPDLRPFLRKALRAGKRVLLPRFDTEKGIYRMVEIHNLDTDLVIGKYQLQEPHPDLPAAELKWCDEKITYLVPAVAFDASGNRLGRGGGYYDRLLQLSKGDKIGVIYQIRFFDRIPTAPHDRRMNFVITEKCLTKMNEQE